MLLSRPNIPAFFRKSVLHRSRRVLPELFTPVKTKKAFARDSATLNQRLGPVVAQPVEKSDAILSLQLEAPAAPQSPTTKSAHQPTTCTASGHHPRTPVSSQTLTKIGRTSVACAVFVSWTLIWIKSILDTVGNATRISRSIPSTSPSSLEAFPSDQTS